MKKLLLILFCSLICAVTFAQSETTGDISWNISDSTLTISGTGAIPDFHAYNLPPWAYNKSFNNVIICEGISSIGVFAFSFNNIFTSVAIPNSVTTIRNWAFSSSRLISITIPSSVTTIGEYAFENCQILTSITIPNSVTSIGEGAFADCSSLTEITNHATQPQKISIDVFENVDKITCILRVPAASVAAYQAANVWKEFGKIEAITTN